MTHTLTITSIKTSRFTPNFPISQLIAQLPHIKPNSIICITTKIMSLYENQVHTNISKSNLIKQQADIYLGNLNGIELAIIQDILMPNAGIDQSNVPYSTSTCNSASNHSTYISWPKNCNATAKMLWHEIRQHLASHDQFAVLLTDTKTNFCRRGAVGICTGCYGINPLKSYINKPDLNGRPLIATKVNVVDSLAAIAVMMMGESNEQTPIVLLENVQQVEFCPTTVDMLNELKVDLQDDLYGYGKLFI